jgi:hypothetical protein
MQHQRHTDWRLSVVSGQLQSFGKELYGIENKNVCLQNAVTQLAQG